MRPASVTLLSLAPSPAAAPAGGVATPGGGAGAADGCYPDAASTGNAVGEGLAEAGVDNTGEELAAEEVETLVEGNGSFEEKGDTRSRSLKEETGKHADESENDRILAEEEDGSFAGQDGRSAGETEGVGFAERVRSSISRVDSGGLGMGEENGDGGGCG